MTGRRRAPRLSVLLVTKRPEFLCVILALLARQSYRDFEIILLTHGFDLADLPPGLDGLLGFVGAAPIDWSLGRCLNAAIAQARGDVLAKIDDDDLYGRDYLAEAVAALAQYQAGVVCKTEYYAYIGAERSLVLRNAGWSERAQDVVRAGSTLVFLRRLGEYPGFGDWANQVGMRFGDACILRGERIFATTRRHYIHRRFGPGHGHTGLVDDDFLRSTGLVLRTGIMDASPLGLLGMIGEAPDSAEDAAAGPLGREAE